MKTFIAVLTLAAALATTPALAIEIEPQGRVGANITPEVLDALTAVIQLSGYRCDSVTIARLMAWDGYKIICNYSRHSYEVDNPGGRWIVRVDY